MNATLISRFIRGGSGIFSVALLGIVLILVLPISPAFIDLFLVMSMTLSILIILTVANLKDPTEFFVFPTVLLFTTLFRLGLNVATTRSILVNADAGHLITAFGEFGVSGNAVVGIVVFIILTIINFMVITKGAGRVAEVSARFTLDAMPGKQMAIDADLNAGIISEKEARDRRQGIQREASFYGAMDGASKFVSGDAIAGIIITLVNLIGGFAIGVLQKGYSVEESIHKFSLLSIGDGLVTQIPALITSVAAGILVTRSSSGSALGEDFSKQLFASGKVMITTGVALCVLALVPGFPTVSMLGIGVVLFGISYFLPKNKVEAEKLQQELKSKEQKDKEARDREQRPETILKLDPLALEIGLDLLPLVNGNVKGMLDRLSVLRRSLSQDLGIIVPSIAVRDNPSLPSHQYSFLLRGHDVASGDLYLGQFLAMGVGTSQKPLRGRATKEPAFGLPATWIVEAERREAERLGYAVVDPLSVLITHVSETLRRHAADIFTRQDTQNLLDTIKETHVALLAEIKLLQINVGLIHRVLQGLLREGISIRELPVILEKLCDQVGYTKNPDEIVEACRKVLSLEICRHLEIQENKLLCITMVPELEQYVAKGVRQSQQDISLVLDPGMARHLHEHLQRGSKELSRQGRNPVLLCSPLVRLGLKRFFAESFPLLQIAAYNEIPSKYDVQPAYAIPNYAATAPI
ncbi:flagellar biosynthesis protein FlhA [Verrucomicrobium sp. GAS474]|uniref:flagellar biosynthesis protein FlhA n=1 Tax=Verrucomicrobium sp. GAS474 TaxID=1882831 RepID=UPI00087BAB6B|nr:flagellar biosynthesis protein FlhA [Verrucomicrobium sp. GAS474]SDU24818.1 flagellar biosynthesis protein FlhA [Verrucomicrobium sp. GAS474]